MRSSGGRRSSDERRCALWCVGRLDCPAFAKRRLGERSVGVNQRRQSYKDNACCGDKRNETGHGTLPFFIVDDREIVPDAPS